MMRCSGRTSHRSSGEASSPLLHWMSERRVGDDDSTTLPLDVEMLVAPPRESESPATAPMLSWRWNHSRTVQPSFHFHAVSRSDLRASSNSGRSPSDSVTGTLMPSTSSEQ
eukprot:CAMPEP_0119327534 /NCGR_PEP_ID=MMETSP1333-20130426/71035_1 /TAXON_ID=418940 /ORGANISM="Scyphosphaera apsteinii, Strain RCC1455" /LENGTH=110 /DNA_ID=CAMNT_0007336153 /DNA_START=49 /DNA_END=378 /DNA_ORIENTATION=+